MATSKIQVTKDYGLFVQDKDNRNLELEKHKSLFESMKKWGFLPYYPIVCIRDRRGRLVVKSGQHRLHFAKQLGLPVYFVVAEENFDVAEHEATHVPWILLNYLEKWKNNGSRDCQEVIDFSAAHSIPCSLAAALLAGVTFISSCRRSIIEGTYKVNDRAWANSVVGIYLPLVQMAKEMKNARLIEACMAVCRVSGFDGRRLVNNAKRCRDKLCAYSTRDAYLEMLEEVYNFGRKDMVGLKSAAIMEMRNRNPANANRSNDQAA